MVELLQRGRLTLVPDATGRPSRCLTLAPASVTAATSHAIAAYHATCLPGEGRQGVREGKWGVMERRAYPF